MVVEIERELKMLTPIDKEPLRRKLRKILELTQRGQGGEKRAAQYRLDELCRQYNIDLDTIFQDQDVEFTIKYNNKGELTVLTQIICVILGTGEVTYAPRSKIIKIKCSPLLKAEILTKTQIYLYDYRRQLAEKRKELSLFPRAFIARNNIYDSSDPEDDTPLTEAEKEEIMKVVAIANGLERTKVYPLLESK